MAEHPLAAELAKVVTDWIDRAPRSLQTRIGPSEVGIECQRRVGHILAGTPKQHTQPVSWPAFVGTALHREMEGIFTIDDAKRWQHSRWHVEQKVTVLPINGTEVSGSCDLYDAHTRTVVDWKFPSKARVAGYRRAGDPGRQYRVQAHGYGIGWVRAGFEVDTVGIFFWARDGQVGDRWFWSEPFDPDIAAEAWEQAHGTAQLLDALTPAVALPLLPTADSFCGHCPYWLPGATDLATACPGHPESRAATQPLTSLAGALGFAPTK